MIKKIIAFVLLFLSFIALKAQDIHLKSFYNGKAVFLRWYPASYDLYMKYVPKGFVVERRNVGAGEDWKELGYVNVGSFEEIEDCTRREPNALLLNIMLHQKEMLKKYESQMPDSIKNNMDKYKPKPDKAQNDYVYGMMLVQTEFNTEVAKNAGLNFVDEYIHTQNIYEYRVRPADSKIKCNSQVIRVETNSKDVLLNMTKVDMVQNDRSLYFSWPVTKQLKADYSGYQMERSTDGKNFKRINKNPIILIGSKYNPKDTCLFRDTLPKCGQTYYYRVVALNRFGLKSPASNVIVARCEDEFTAEATNVKAVCNKKNEIVLKWDIHNPDNQKIDKIVVKRSESMKSSKKNFVAISKELPSNIREFVDKKPLRNNHYEVCLYGMGNQETVSFPVYESLPDSLPPSAPTGLKGTIDSLGVVRLSWNPNPEEGIRGYYVMYSNDSLQAYANANSKYIKETEYVDSLFLGSLTNDIYFKVRAVGNNYAYSDPSAPIKLVKPDTIAPAKPVFKEITQNEDATLNVEWYDSPSKDVAKIELSRKVSPDSAWTTLKVWNGKKTNELFVDTTIMSNKNVAYRLRIWDESENMAVTESNPFKTKYIKRQCVKSVNTEVDYQRGSIRVTWKNAGCGAQMNRIYRKEDGNASRILTTVEGREHLIYDEDVKKGHTYQYIVLPITEKGDKGDKSEPVKF